MWRVVIGLALLAAALPAQPRRVLYITYSAGFRHDSIPVSIDAMRQIASRSTKLEVVATEDLSLLTRDSLRDFDAVFFFTSGELPLSDQQKSDLLAFVRAGGGFGGAHSATDTFYTWPEYGELIGARFDGHPWVQQVRIDVEDSAHPATHGLALPFSITDEIYQFREFSRDRVRVLMTLDASSVDLNASGVHRTDKDFALSWVRSYGSGRVFYTALGHFDDTWRNQQFQTILQGALLWLTKQNEGDASPRPAVQPVLVPNGIGNAATLAPPLCPGTLFSVFGRNLTPGSTAAADPPEFRTKLAGATVSVNGIVVPLLYASPEQINGYLPADLKPHDCVELCAGRTERYDFEITSAGSSVIGSVAAASSSPGIFTTTRNGGYLTIWATGLGPIEGNATVERPSVTVGGKPARILYSGVAPGIPGLYQINIELPEFTAPATLEMRFGAYDTRLPL